MEHLILYLIVGILVADFFLDQVLDWLNAKTWKERCPPELSDFYNEETYRKARRYNQEHRRLSIIQEAVSFPVILAMIVGGGFAFVDDLVREYTTHPILMALLFFGILMLASDLLNLPFSIYRTFKIEEDYDFNKTSPTTFATDRLKGYVLTGVLGGGVLSLVILFFQWAGELAWLWAWIAIGAILLFFQMFYTSLILPLFNKLTPLRNEEIKTAIVSYSKQVDFPLKNVFVMDGSKRSSKANAFFSGIGSKKKIVLFDTLIEKHSIPELVSVLAHEVGHYKKKHIVVATVLSFAQTGLLLYLLSWLVYNPALSSALGAESPSFHIGILAFGILFSPVSTLLGIGMNLISRKHEYEADRFASSTASADALRSALKKLSVTHLSNLHPHPAYVFVNYSHPPVVERLRAMNGN